MGRKASDAPQVKVPVLVEVVEVGVDNLQASTPLASLRGLGPAEAKTIATRALAQAGQRNTDGTPPTVAGGVRTSCGANPRRDQDLILSA
jgi:hypothetical protein